MINRVSSPEFEEAADQCDCPAAVQQFHTAFSINLSHLSMSLLLPNFQLAAHSHMHGASANVAHLCTALQREAGRQKGPVMIWSVFLQQARSLTRPSAAPGWIAGSWSITTVTWRPTWLRMQPALSSGPSPELLLFDASCFLLLQGPGPKVRAHATAATSETVDIDA